MEAIKGLFGVFMGWMLLACCMVAEAQVDDYERFQLFTECQPMAVGATVYVSDEDTGTMIRQQEQEGPIYAALESRLRAARLYQAQDQTRMQNHINVSVIVPTPEIFIMLATYSKILRDPITQQLSISGTWELLAHGSPSAMHSLIAQAIDSFLVDYLRVNEAACRER